MDFEFEAAMTAGTVSLLILLLCWPKKMRGPVQDYLNILHPVYWTEESKIFDKILKLHPMLDLNDHNRILVELHEKGIIECDVSSPEIIQEIERLDRFDKVYMDHMEPFSTICVSYRLARKDGGKRRRFTLLPQAT